MTRRLLLAVFSALAVVAFVVLEVVAMDGYPGGTWTDAHTQGYSFSKNFFCDLTSPVALCGSPNPSVPYARVAMVALALGLLPFFASVSELAGSRRRAVVGAGLLGALGAATIPFLPTSLVGEVHGVVSIVSGGLGMLAAAMVIRGAFDRKAWLVAVLGALAFLAGGVVAALYLLVLTTRAEVTSLPLAQKVAAALLLAWMCTPLATLERPPRRYSHTEPQTSEREWTTRS